MARLARIILPGYPHHITQRGNRRQDVFFCDEDYEAYLSLLKTWCGKAGIEIWVYCLMTNHVHLIVQPDKASNLSRAIGETHRRYTRMINFREKWRGYLWQGRDDKGIVVEPLLSLIGDWRAYLQELQPKDMPDFERHERTDRLLGDDDFVQLVEKLLGRSDSMVLNQSVAHGIPSNI